MLQGYAERLRKTSNGLPLWTTEAIQYHRHGRLTNPHGVRKLSLRQALGFHQLAEPLGEIRFLLMHESTQTRAAEPLRCLPRMRA